MGDKKFNSCSWMLTVVPVMLVLTFCGPGLLSAGWYLFHRHQVIYKGKIVTIPFGWSLAAEDVEQNEITGQRIRCGLRQADGGNKPKCSEQSHPMRTSLSWTSPVTRALPSPTNTLTSHRTPKFSR